MAIERLSVILELITGNYNREAKQAADATGRIGNSAKSATGSLSAMLGPAAIGGAIIGLGKMAAVAIESASTLQQSIGGVESVFGSVSDKIHEFGETSAESVGLATSSFNNLALLTGALLKNMGVPLDETADKTLILTERAADLAATFGGPVSKAVEAINSALKGEANPIEAYGIKLNAAAVEARVLADNTGLLKREITDAHKAQAIYNIILDQSADSAGQFGREVNTVAGQQERFKAELENTRAEIGTKLLPVMTRLLESGRKLIPVFQDIAEEIVDVVAELQPFVDLVIPLIDHVANLKVEVDDLSESSDGLGRSFGMAFDSMINPLKAWDTAWKEVMALFAKTPAVVGEVHDSWTVAAAGIAAAEISLSSAIGPTIALLDRQWTSHRNVAKAADTQRTAMINLSNAQADLLDPIANVLRLQKDSEEAQKRLTDAQKDGDTSASDLAIATIEAEQAFLRLQGAGAALTPDQIQAFAQLLITQFGHSEESALDLLDTLNLLDGWQGRATFTLEGVSNAAGTSGVRGTGNINSLFDQFGFASGGIVPGPRGSQQVVLAHGGETILPTHRGGSYGGSTTIVVQSPMNDFRSDMQYATILASVTNLVEGF